MIIVLRGEEYYQHFVSILYVNHNQNLFRRNYKHILFQLKVRKKQRNIQDFENARAKTIYRLSSREVCITIEFVPNAIGQMQFL